MFLELIHSLQIFGVSLRTQVGTKDSETKKALKGFSRILPGMFKVSDDVSPLQLAIANHALLVFVHLKDVTSCRDVVRTEVCYSNYTFDKLKFPFFAVC